MRAAPKSWSKYTTHVKTGNRLVFRYINVAVRLQLNALVTLFMAKVFLSTYDSLMQVIVVHSLNILRSMAYFFLSLRLVILTESI